MSARPDPPGSSGRSRGAAGPPSLVAFAILALLALVVAHLLDHWTYLRWYDPHVYDRDWGRMLRTMGFLPFWLLAALALALHDGAGRTLRSWRRGWARAWLLVVGPAAAGTLGELLKLLIRRERPWAHGGDYVFRAFTDHPFSSAGLSMPSSHSVVAFGAAFGLARLFPRAAPVGYLLAAGCAFTRVAARAHFLSDVVLGALLAWLVVAVLWHRFGAASAAAPDRTDESLLAPPSQVGGSAATGDAAAAAGPAVVAEPSPADAG